MRATALVGVVAAVGVVALALRVRRDARAWAEWDRDESEPTEDRAPAHVAGCHANGLPVGLSCGCAAPEPDPYAELVPMAAWTGNSATYYVNPTTGVVVSAN